MNVCKIRVCRNNVIHLLKIGYKAGRVRTDAPVVFKYKQT